MKKQFVASLLALSMTLSMLPLSAFAEETSTSAEVGSAVESAQESAKDAALSSAAAGQVTTAVDQALAAANEKLAQDNLDAAKDVIDKVNDENTKRAEEAEKAEKDVQDAFKEADKDAEDALNANHAAQGALEEADAAKNKDQAQAAADKAETKAEEAEAAAGNAQTAATTAAAAAEEAKKAYEAADIAAKEAEANAKQQLEAGLISAEQAAELTKKAAEEANAKYEEMKKASEAANAAKEAAKAEADKAKETLKAESEKLADMVKDNAEEIAKDTANVLVTGAALEASKVAVDIAGKVVDAYEGELEDLKEQVDELDKAINAADQAIAEANEKLAALDEEDAEYPKAKAELEAAENAKKAAEAEKAKAEEFIANRDQEQIDKMTGLQDEVKNADLATNEGKQSVKDLTNMVLGYNKETYGNIEWQDTAEDGRLIFKSTTTAEDGTPTVQYYEVKKNEDGVLQYYKTDRKEDHTAQLPDDAKQAFNDANPGTQLTVDSGLKAVYTDKNGNRVEETIKIVKVPKTFFVTKESYTYTVNGMKLKQDSGKWYYEPLLGGDRVYVNVEDPNVFNISYETEANAISDNSNTVTDAWANAEQKVKDAEEKIQQAEEHLQGAKESYDTAKKAYDEAKDALDAVIAENTDTKAATQEQIDQLQEKIDDLNLKLNGNLADQVVRDALDGYREGGIEGAVGGVATGAAGKIAPVIAEGVALNAEKVKLEAKKLFGTATEEELKRLELLPTLIEDNQKKQDQINKELGDVSDIVETVRDLATIMDHLNNGEFNKEDLEKAVELLGSTTVSAKTRQSIAKLVESIMETKHEEAKQELQDAIDKAQADLTEQGGLISDAAKDALKAELAYAEATAKAELAKAAAKRYEDMNNKAQKAAQDAENARRAYEGLKDAVSADSTLLEILKNAADEADKLAKDTQAAADAAKAEAKAAREAAEKAQEIAKNFPKPKRSSDEGTVVNTAVTVEMTPADYAYSLLGALPVGFPSDMTSARFVELVYAHFGIQIDLSSSNKPQDVAKNGTRLERTMAQKNDITCVLSVDGLVDVFGVYYGSGVYVFYNEATRQVETARAADAPYDWFPLRVTK